VWKIQTLNFLPQYEGAYETGGPTGSQTSRSRRFISLPIRPACPFPTRLAPPAIKPRSTTGAARPDAERREPDAQSAGGLLLISRRCGTTPSIWHHRRQRLRTGGVGVFDGLKGVRKALERQGPAGLTEGVLNDRLQFDTTRIARTASRRVSAASSWDCRAPPRDRPIGKSTSTTIGS
jgi:hypothetical protein